MTQTDRALRDDIRRLGHQLGDALTRQHGPRLLDLVEQVRSLTKQVRQEEDAAAAEQVTQLLGSLDLNETIQLMRAFTAYFYLANAAEQVHRIEELAETDVDHSLAATRSEEHTSELQSRENLVCRLLLEKKNNISTV